MDKNSLLYQLMAMRMNGIMNGVAERDEDYQTSLSAADPYIDQLKALHLPKKTRQLIDDCVSAHVAIGSCSLHLPNPERRFPSMDSYSLSYTLDPEQGWILSGLVRRCRDINGWGPASPVCRHRQFPGGG